MSGADARIHARYLEFSRISPLPSNHQANGVINWYDERRRLGKLERVEVVKLWNLRLLVTAYSGFRFPLAVPQTLRQREEGLAVPFVMLDSQALAVSRLLPNLPPCRACAMRCCQRASAVATDWQACCV